MAGLRECRIESDCGTEPLRNHNLTSGNTEVVFCGIEDRLIEFVTGADLIVGCVAWLTNKRILSAMKMAGGVSLVVQKEDFLRPDLGSSSRWKVDLRRLYETLPAPPDRFAFAGLVGSLSYCYDPTFDPVRCMGNHNAERSPAFPRMHNKFLVKCKHVESTQSDNCYPQDAIAPIEVWTGSFNFTANAVASLENAVIIRDEAVATAYFNEWQQILALSENLDWESQWIAPEWRIGS
jgi:hypothetical protein